MWESAAKQPQVYCCAQHACTGCIVVLCGIMHTCTAVQHMEQVCKPCLHQARWFISYQLVQVLVTILILFYLYIYFWFASSQMPAFVAAGGTASMTMKHDGLCWQSIWSEFLGNSWCVGSRSSDHILWQHRPSCLLPPRTDTAVCATPLTHATNSSNAGTHSTATACSYRVWAALKPNKC